MNSLFGPVITEAKADPVIAGIVAGRVSGFTSKAGANGAAPRIVVSRGPITRAPGGATANTGLQGATFGFNCYGPAGPDATGPIVADQLVGAVVDCFHQRRWRATNGKTIHHSTVLSIGALLPDPDTHEPFATVWVYVVGGA